MKLLLDQGLPRSAALYLRNAGVEAVHVGDIGLGDASDAKILDTGRSEGTVVVTLDADFHALLALAKAAQPSVIRIRMEGLRAQQLASLLVNVIKLCSEDFMKGAVVSVTENGIRVRRLPLLG